jgi:BirA family biotin operon repressor/biotin-[acetyl-CoA-carboxylase] ligase
MKSEEIAGKLKSVSFGRTLYSFDELDSTNVYAKNLAREGAPEGTVVIAETQTQGKGRMGRSWHSSSGKNLTFSVILRPRITAHHRGLISLYAGLSVANAVCREADLDARCKWPNDVLVDGRKLCGILSEAIFDGTAPAAVVLGIGLNVNERDFPSALRTPATSLAMLCGREFDRAGLLAGLLLELESSLPLLEERNHPSLIGRWSDRSAMLGREIEIDQDGRVTRGIARAIGEDGQLILETREGTHRIIAGDATFV